MIRTTKGRKVFQLSKDVKQAIRKTVGVLLSGRIGGGKVHAQLPKKITVTIERFSDRVEITWDSAEPVEAVIPFLPDPDLLSITAYRDHSRIRGHVGTLKVDH